MIVVVDASAILEVLLAKNSVDPRIDALASSQTDFIAPHLIDLEIVQTLRRQLHKGEISEKRAQEALSQLDALPVDRADHAPLLPLIWRLRHNFSAYDAAYIALAQALDAPLLTLDARLAQAAHTFTRVEIV